MKKPAHLPGGGFYLLLILAACVIPFALAQQSPTNPRPPLQDDQQAMVRFTPRRDFGGDESVAWQNNTAHDGYDPASPLVTPLSLRWTHDFSGSGVGTISYPLIAQGL